MFPVSIKGVLVLPSDEVVLALNDRDEWSCPVDALRLERALPSA